ncbi:hypothetical protein TanjilG_04568 [Lupinus angustifolius]|uniref:Uncharacterized protein n=1 Tax=Lupinus angustifolius TaxID=3871 RepID=A0A4P1RQX4_LUPAN|nr:hypothetical protein TanjilG_04568 [Lupinus angustifolius]
MSLQSSSSDNPETQSPATGGNGVRSNRNGTVLSNMRLRLNPSKEHEPDDYEDMELEYSAALLSSLEMYLPPNMLNDPRHEKAKFMQDILIKYLPPGERRRV